MAHRIISQIVITGSRVIGRAFVEAYKQAQASHAYTKAGATAGTSSSSSSFTSPHTDRRFGGLALDEACQILNVKTPNPQGKLTGLTMEEMLERYKRLYDANDPTKGGSFYIQSKVYRAMERIKPVLDKEAAVKEEMAASKEAPKVYKDNPPS